jgi:hypothetical protein
MRNALILGPIVVTLAMTSLSAQRRNLIEEQPLIRRTIEFPVGGTTKMVEVDNISGSIQVTGSSSRTVEMVAKQTIRASSEDRLRAAKAEVKLDVSEKSDIISIFVDDPSRQGVRPSVGRIPWVDPGYEVIFDFELRVPRDVKVRLKTINGNIVVQSLAGDFNVEGLNGTVEMGDISGSGRAHTLNGAVNVIFSESPKSDSSFGSLNGNIDVTFPKSLSADIRFKSFNGGVFTDFPIGAVPAAAITPEVRSGRIIFKNEFSLARIGSGGPTLEFDGFNGDVRIRQAK